jgi:hypothetical protein
MRLAHELQHFGSAKQTITLGKKTRARDHSTCKPNPAESFLLDSSNWVKYSNLTMIDYRGGMREFLRWLGIYLKRGKYMKRPLRSVIRGEPSQVTSCDKKILLSTY